MGCQDEEEQKEDDTGDKEEEEEKWDVQSARSKPKNLSQVGMKPLSSNPSMFFLGYGLELSPKQLHFL